MAKILGNSKKINGTIGSINRRLARRFSREWYGSYISKVKLIDYKNEYYELVCDPHSIKIALLVVESGFKAEDGNINLNYPMDKSAEFRKKHNLYENVKIEWYAVEMAMKGYSYIDDVDWEYEVGNQTFNFSVAAARTIPSAIITLETEAGVEWVTEEPDHDNARINGNPWNWNQNLIEIEIDENPINYFWALEADERKRRWEERNSNKKLEEKSNNNTEGDIYDN